MMTNSIPKIIKKIMPAVVSIVISKNKAAVEKDIKQSQNMLPAFPWENPEKQEIPEEMVDSHGMVKIGSGSGFLVREDGVIVTNKHVVADKEAEYGIYTNDGKKYPAEILARDPLEDIAILKIEAKELPVVELGDSDGLELGMSVLAIGNALGLFKNTVSSGIVSGLSRAIQANAPGDLSQQPMMQELRGLIQTDAAINPGNSGGPLIDLDGRVVGINAAVIFGAQNLNFALPINAVKRDLEDLKKHGRITRPLLGLRYVTIDEMTKDKMKLAVDYGALVMGQGPHHHSGIVPHSPADKAGLQNKDIVLECNGQKVTREKTIQDFLETMAVGDTLHMKVLRGEKELEIKAVLAERK